MKVGNQQVGLRLRIVLEPGIAVGPGKADLLQAIEQEGSIAAAGRRLRMSYKRAWSLVEALNGNFGAPVVTTSKGGGERGGAELTALGKQILSLYRRMETQAAEAARHELAELRGLIRRKGA